MNISFRIANTLDAPVVNELSKQLGYDNKVADTELYIQALRDTATEQLMVAEYQESVIGWVQLSYMLRAESGNFIEITDLVVDEYYRSAGIGNKLIVYAKEYCREKRLNKLKVRTNIVRHRTHSFYERNGFKLRKEQKVYEMEV